MKILVVNPNTTPSMTALIEAAAKSVAAPGTTVTSATPSMGPVSVEGYYDEVFCVPGLLDEIAKGAAQGVDGFVVACFDDLGLDAARALVPQPVVAIAEAGMHAATLVAHGFSVVTTLPRAIPVIEDLALRYGFERRCRRVRAVDLPVLALEDPASAARHRLAAEIEKAIKEDGAEAILLGCAGMADLARDLSAEFSLPVIDGVAAATKLVEALVGLGLKTSKIGGYAPPLPKTYTGELARFAPRR